MSPDNSPTFRPTSEATAFATLSPRDLADFRAAFDANPAYRLAMNACTSSNVDDIALDRRVLANLDWTFSHEIKTGAITNQKRAGFCWLFAALNWFRIDVIAKLNVEDFEFSTNYLVFWDRLEKANRFLAEMVVLRDRTPDDRDVDMHLREPCPDGGEWHMVANLIGKYGLVPKTAMADTANLDDSKYLNKVVNFKLREAAAAIFSRHRAGADAAEINQLRYETMGTIYRILCILLGEPPTRFDYCYRDKDEHYHARRGLTPHTFYQDFVSKDLADYVWLMNAPLEGTPYGRTYYVERFQNVVEGQWGVFLNVPMPELKAIAVRALKDKQAIMFGCDVTQESSRKWGVLDPGILSYELLFGTNFKMDRAQRMQFLQTTMTHEMVFLGVDVVDDQPVKWKVENSWGDEVGHKGHFQMSDAWFDEHVYSIVIPRQYLGHEQTAQLEQPPTALPAWHPLA
jgi:bleomycin hydrolase